MLGYSEYHHDLIYKYVTLFGSLFTGIEVYRQGTVEDELVKVPLNFASVQKVLAFAEKQHLSNQMAVATLLPRMSFDIVDIAFDPTRKLNKFEQVCLGDNTIRAPQPYNISFTLNLMTKTERDATRIVEQIIPHFTPSVSLTMFPFTGETVSHDIHISLVNVGRNNEYQGMAENRQTIVWTLMFELQGWLYGPVKTDSSIIKKIKINYRDDLGDTVITPGLTDQGNPTTDPLETIDYTLVEADDDWDFIIEHSDHGD